MRSVNGAGPDWLNLGWLRGGAASSQCRPSQGRVNSISDGDIPRANWDGEQVWTRLHCIDAPELGQRPWSQQTRA